MKHLFILFLLSCFATPLLSQDLQTETKQLLEYAKAHKLKKKKIITTASGLMICIQKKGKGAIPTKGQNIKANYKLVNLKDKKIDSSYDRNTPFEFPLGAGRVIKAWDEAFGAIPVGTTAVILAPSSLAYGARAMGEDMPANSPLIFYVELLDAK